MTTSRAGQVLDAGLILADAAAVTVPAMREMIDQQPPGMRRLIGYQLGWWDTDGARIEGRQGKTLRPALSLLSCQAVGGVVDQAIPAAVAVELLHNGMLVHDDIIDEDELRRGRPTLWKVYGVPTAILVGDVLFLLPAQVLVRAHAPLCIQGPDRLVSALQISMDGGVTEILLEQRATATFAEVTQVIAAKTSALMAASCALGAVAAGADPDRIDHFHAFGHHLGTAFQIADDLLGVLAAAAGFRPVSGAPAGTWALPDHWA
ncbi:polyprenyl synthetase family protein, partial [Streptomyces spectabilis]|uniref:polyprenyl synthetase family protein n=1 Tax=Streptomyces spectabilis TaxID=68270 RepID=UPI0033D20198